MKTIYDVWKSADGLFAGQPEDKLITFKSSSDGSVGFVRVVGGEEGYTTQGERTFRIPSGASFEVLGCMVKFTRA